MEKDNYYRLMRPLAPSNEKIFDISDFADFRPSYEYLISRETKTCQHCRSLIYNQINDVGNLSILEILEAKYFPKNQPSKSALDLLNDISIAYGSVFSDYMKKMKPKSNKELYSSFYSELKQKLNISDKVFNVPIFHRCNKCYMTWNIHLEIKQRILPPERFLLLKNIKQKSTSEFFLPKVENFYQGIIFLSEKDMEEEKVGKHIITVKKMFLEDNGASLILAKKHISQGDLGSAVNILCKFTDRQESKFYYITALQLQSRFSIHIQEKLKGTISHQEETLQLNRISNDTIMLIEEIQKYQSM